MRIYIISFLLFISLHAVGQSTPFRCSTYIYLDVDKSASVFESNGDTIKWKENSEYYLRILLKSCKGGMYIERRLNKDDRLIFAGFYEDAVQSDSVVGWGIDPVTGEKKRQTSQQYRPLRTGVWKFYDQQTGKLKATTVYQHGEVLLRK
jgi:hypothetical protein